MSRDHRAKLTATEFDSIRVDENDPIDNHYDKLINRNAKFRRIGQEYAQGFLDARLLEQLTKGQQLLVLLGALDGEVKNGGITQFFWNCQSGIFEVRDAIEFLGDLQMLRNYDQALEALVGAKDRWLELRKEWCEAGVNANWKTFQQTYELLDLEWFDDAYFDKGEYDEKKKWVLQQRGLHHALMLRLVEYINSHRVEFIEE